MKLGDVSPLAGAITGEGMTADLMEAGGLGILPAAIMRDRKRKDKATQAPTGMKKGGKVKKMKSGGKVRGAGCAKKGTRPCKMC